MLVAQAHTAIHAFLRGQKLALYGRIELAAIDVLDLLSAATLACGRGCSVSLVNQQGWCHMLRSNSQPHMHTDGSMDLEAEVAARLRAIMAEFEISGNREFGEVCGATNSAVNNWKLGYNLPRVPEMIRLCEATGITLDWLYRGHIGSMDPQLGIRLSRRTPGRRDE